MTLIHVCPELLLCDLEALLKGAIEQADSDAHGKSENSSRAKNAKQIREVVEPILGLVRVQKRVAASERKLNSIDKTHNKLKAVVKNWYEERNVEIPDQYKGMFE